VPVGRRRGMAGSVVTPRSSSQQVSATEVLTTRVVYATPERVFDAWVDPGKLTLWWGPKGFTSTFHAHDPRPGGEWRFTLHGPDGRDYKNHSVYAEVVPPKRLVIDHVSGPTYRACIDFEPLDGCTRIVWRMRFENARFLAEHGALVVGANLENLDRLEAVLAARSTSVGSMS
jgi:uncharacterized protein YndB with AHSA1/START domain